MHASGSPDSHEVKGANKQVGIYTLYGRQSVPERLPTGFKIVAVLK